MPDNTPAPTDGNEGKDGAPAPKGDEGKPNDPPAPVDWEARYNELSGKHRKQSERLSALEEDAKKRKQEKFEKTDDAEEIRKTARAEIEAERTKAQNLQTQLHAVVIEKEIISLAAALEVTDPEDFYIRFKDDFEVGEDSDGRAVAQVKKSALTPKEHISKILQAKPHWKRNTRKGGAGSDPSEGSKEGGKNGGVGIPADFNTWPRDKQIEFFRKNPNLPPPKLGR